MVALTMQMASMPTWLMYLVPDPSQHAKVLATFREASSHSLLMARIWVFSDDENRPFQFSPKFHSQQIPKVAYYQAYSSARCGGTSAGGLPIVFMSMHMSSLCMTPISIPTQACRHLIPMFFFLIYHTHRSSIHLSL